MQLTPSEQILEHLIGFPTVSRDSNLELIAWVRNYLDDLGIASKLVHNEENTKANLYATIGPAEVPGVMLSGHTDVVPVDGQPWTKDPFAMSLDAGRLYGRGTTDMKGFIACVLAALPDALNRNLERPIHLAFSYDEEIGCVGVQRLLDTLEGATVQPAFCIVGEPTSMEVAIAHKGKTAALVTCNGVESHSALVDHGVNAIYLATEMIQSMRGIQESVKLQSEHDHHYSVPYTTIHVGTIEGGTALNIVPRSCSFRFEIRNLGGDDPEPILRQIRAQAAEIAGAWHDRFPGVSIDVEVYNQYPALETSAEESVVKLVQRLMDTDDFVKLPFGTEAGLFQSRLGVPGVVCGPGSMDQGHKPDEFISRTELARCDGFLKRLIDSISSG